MTNSAPLESKFTVPAVVFQPSRELELVHVEEKESVFRAGSAEQEAVIVVLASRLSRQLQIGILTS